METRKHNLSLIADRMEAEALYLENQLILLQNLIESLRVMESQGAPIKAREGVEALHKDLKEELEYLNGSLKYLASKIC